MTESNTVNIPVKFYDPCQLDNKEDRGIYNIKVIQHRSYNIKILLQIDHQN